MSIVTNLQSLADVKANLKAEIEARGRDLTAKNFDEWPSEVALIDGGAPATGDHEVTHYDYDGTILRGQFVDDGLNGSAPADPAHAGLTFQGWTQDVLNVTHDRQIGAMYITDDGSSRAYITLTPVTGLAPTLYFHRTGAGTLTVNWGDGTPNWTSTSTGNINTGAHTYAVAGDYVITISIDTGTYTFGNASAATTFVGGSTQVYRDTLVKMEIGDGVDLLGNYAFSQCRSLETVIIPPTISSIGAGAFYEAYSLKSIVIPTGVTGVDDDSFNSSFSLAALILPNTMITTGEYTFSYLYSLTSLVIPDSVCAIGTAAFMNCFALNKVHLPDNAALSVGADAFINCVCLQSINIPDNATLAAGALRGCRAIGSVAVPASIGTIADDMFNDWNALTSVTLLNGPTSIGDRVFRRCFSLQSLTIPASVESLGVDVFQTCYALRELVLEREGTITTTGTPYAGTVVPMTLKIYVPDALVLTYKAASNWSTWANFIYPLSERP